MGKPIFFGDPTFSDDRLEQIEAIDALYDRSYVPGYSERQIENERRRSKGEAELPSVRCQWIPCSRPDGSSTDGRDMMPWYQLGYKFVEESDFERLGITSMPPCAVKGPDGLIRRGDLALAYVDEARAKHNRKVQDSINAEQQGTVKGNVEVEESRGGVGSFVEVMERLRAERPEAPAKRR